MSEEQTDSPAFLPNWTEEFQGFFESADSRLHPMAEILFKQCQGDIKTLLAYTDLLGKLPPNPFEKALDFPLHPRMTLI